jgi:hypothetical protein
MRAQKLYIALMGNRLWEASPMTYDSVAYQVAASS